MKNLIIILGLLVSFGADGQPANIAPLELVTKVFTNQDFVPEIPKYSTGKYGEYGSVPNASTYNHAYQLSFRLLTQDSATAIVNIILDSLRQGKDIYVHLQKEEVWKIAKIRSLPINNLQQEDWKYLQHRKAQIDSLKITDSNYQTPAGFERSYAFSKMWFALDDQVIDYFKENESKYKIILQEYKNQQKENANRINPNENTPVDDKNLLIRRVSNSDYCPDCYDFLIDEFVYSSLGYLYIPNPEDVPKMNGETDIIVVKAMGNGWYFYKKN